MGHPKSSCPHIRQLRADVGHQGVWGTRLLIATGRNVGHPNCKAGFAIV